MDRRGTPDKVTVFRELGREIGSSPMPRRMLNQTGCVTLVPPRMTTQGLEVSLHTCPKSLMRELRHVFPGVSLDECLAVPTNQHAALDLVNIGDRVEGEKDRLLNSMLSGGNKVYSEVEGMQLLLQYQVMNAGMCKVLLHPAWGSSVYPASLFSTAPEHAIRWALDEHWAEGGKGKAEVKGGEGVTWL